MTSLSSGHLQAEYAALAAMYAHAQTGGGAHHGGGPLPVGAALSMAHQHALAAAASHHPLFAAAGPKPMHEHPLLMPGMPGEICLTIYRIRWNWW